METKDQLIQSIKDWVKIDNEMRTLQSEISKRKKEKKKISEKLISVMRDNEIDVFDINDGQIMYMKMSIVRELILIQVNKDVLLNVIIQMNV